MRLAMHARLALYTNEACRSLERHASSDHWCSGHLHVICKLGPGRAFFMLENCSDVKLGPLEV